MAINTSIWGLPENWNTFDDDNIIAVIKQPSCKVGDYNYRTFFRLAEYDKIDLNNDIDTSLCVSGMSSECPYSNINYYTVKNGNVESDSQTRALTNWFFFNTSQKSAYTEQNYVTYLYSDGHYGQYRNFENTLSETNNGNRWISPFIDYDIKDFVLLLRVECSDSPTGSQHYYFLDDYISNYYNTYPYVFRIFARLYAKAQTTPLRRKYIYQGVIEGSKYCTTAICNNYETTLVQTNKRMYCNHIASQRGNDIPIWGVSIDRTSNVFPCSDYDEYGLIGIVYGDNADFETTVQNGNLYVYHHVTDITAFAEKARRAAAAFGCYFTGDENTAEYGSLTDTKMYIGVLDDNLIAHGDYLQGTNTADAIQNTWDTVRDSTYNPTADTDKTKYTNDTQFYGTWTSSAFTKMYVLTESQVQQLAAELYTAVSAAPTSEEIERYNQSVFLTQNPIDCIISLKRFPIDLPYSAAVPMKLGSYTTQVNAAPLLYSTGVYSFVFSRSVDNNLYQWFDKSFLDYEPYTKVELTIPFCGTVEIPTTYIYDYDTIDVKLIVDYITGACTAYIQARNITIDSASGDCAVTLPVNGLQSATLDSQIHSAATARDKSALTNGLGLIGGAASLIIGIATGGIGLAVAGGAAAIGAAANMIVNDKNIDYELKHMEAPLKQIGSASGAIAQSYDMRCKMRITRPKISADYDAEVYANTIGFACLINTTVNQLSGLTVGDINLNGLDASDVEKQLIKNAFAGGVIL